jgi:hypothetical protein
MGKEVDLRISIWLSWFTLHLILAVVSACQILPELWKAADRRDVFPIHGEVGLKKLTIRLPVGVSSTGFLDQQSLFRPERILASEH